MHEYLGRKISLALLYHLNILLNPNTCLVYFLNIWMFLVSSQSIPFWDKFVFVTTTTRRLMAHVFDMARDIILIVFLKFAKRGAHYIFHWVSNQ